MHACCVMHHTGSIIYALQYKNYTRLYNLIGISRMGKSAKHPEAVPILNVVKLHISNPQKLYIPGDTISGELLLEVSKGGLTVSKMMICMKCFETCNLESLGAVKFDNMKNTDNLDLSSKVQNCISYGTHKFPFHYTINHFNRRLPPSASFESLGDKVSGIRWYLKAEVELSDPKNTRNPPEPLTRSVLIRFYPIKCVKNDAEKKSSIRKLGSINVNMKIPEVLQQSPKLWDIEIAMLPLKPTMVHSVTVTLRKTVVLWDYINSRVLNEYERIGQVNICKVLSEKLTIDGVSQRWRASEFMTPAFTSCGTTLRYTLLISVLLSEPYELVFPLVDFVSPSLERCGKSQNVENEEERQSPPPDYSVLNGN